jgi:tRNA-dihydrouridine synthase 2
MGCPKHFSVASGMGCDLILHPERAEDIIKSLRRNISIPISVKTRLVSSESDSSTIDIARSIDWLQRLQSSGACAIALHTRTATETSRNPPHEYVLPIMNQMLKKSNTPLIANGDIWTVDDISRIKKESGVSSFMLSRGALWNPGVFALLKMDHRDGKYGVAPSIPDIMTRLVQLAATTANCFLNTKYLLQQVHP